MSLRVKPSIRIPPELFSLTDVLLEQHENFDIYWYHWPMDGIFPGGDYEPIILMYCKDKLFYLIVRKAWEFRHYSIDELVEPIEILFETIFHHPSPRTKDDPFYNLRSALLTERDYDPKIIQPDEIQEKFRTGKGHPTGGGRIFEDPASMAQRTHDEECQQ